MDQVKTEISVAPMMDWTDRHCRYFHRLFSPHARLYTEMMTTGALIHGDRDRYLRFNDVEHPVALQLGGSDPLALAKCATIGADAGYDEINLNCGCPSDRVQNGSFGACLMKDPSRVADCVAAMTAAVKIPVTVKCRIGVDDCDDLPFLMNFIETVKAAGCSTFIVHARKAWLNGLSPRENREIPPLRYDIPAAVKAAHPDLCIIVNGGIRNLDQIRQFVVGGDVLLDGVMIGREAYQNPWVLAEAACAFQGNALPVRREIALAMIPYMERQARDYGTPVKSIARHMTGLFYGQYGGKAWRRGLAESHRDDVTPEGLIRTALAMTVREHISVDLPEAA